ncbi:MAG: hypothetical protein WCT02_01020 [Candidatus Paceibacterota bacterium]
MTYPLIILGAGASYDYSVISKGIAPLTKDLISEPFIDVNLLNDYDDVANLLSSIANQVKSGATTFEHALQDIKDGSEKLPHIRKQFIALEFYLKKRFTDISLKSYPINNYKTLIEKIKRYNDGHACVVTFNYDSFFERAYKQGGFQTMSDYTQDNLKIIKPHGSHDWLYINQKNQYTRSENISDLELYQNDPDFISRLRGQTNPPDPYHEIYINKREASGSEAYAKFPAIAVPLQEKQEHICPQKHFSVLETSIQNADRILIIGWRAADKYFIDILNKNLRNKVDITCVAESSKSVHEIQNNLIRLNMIKKFNLVSSGFSGFVAGNDCVKIFA